ncbi:MAG: L-aspartate oxidase [Verrucomicrobia bacterium]|nr:L-aspartate oxidase [Verrucomicrobiota bacterium]
MRIVDTDYLIVGSGIAGLMSALHLAPLGRVLVLAKKESGETNTSYAQGGIACVMTDEDSFEKHIADTLDAGAGLCDPDVVRSIVTAGPERVAELREFGVQFALRANDAGVESYDLGKEGGHSKRRILHAGDMTGLAIQDALKSRVSSSAAITLWENQVVIDLITTSWLGVDSENRCVGAYVLNRETAEIFAVRASYTVLATGGGGKVYLYTSNPDVATADGVALGWRAGVPIKDMEFIQFHPTCLYHPDAKSFLISEAVRGEGARLVNAQGESFAEKYDPRGALAPRDIAARAIDSEMKATGAPCAYLDIRDKPEAFLRKRFPKNFQTCERFGINMARDLIPVVPAAHYFCGGLEAGVDGRTAVPGLFACGEVACTGLHGANRLASNSLLEAVVSAHAASRAIAGAGLVGAPKHRIPDWELGAAVPSDEAIVVEHNWNEVRTCMWDYVGIVRTNKRLERARTRIQNLRREIREYYLSYLVTPDMLELRNIADVADLIVRSAQARRESRGLHYTLDYPELAAEARDTVISDAAGGA